MSNYYYCLIPSHCEYPDFEVEGYAKNKKEFSKRLSKQYHLEPEIIFENSISEHSIKTYKITK